MTNAQITSTDEDRVMWTKAPEKGSKWSWDCFVTLLFDKKTISKVENEL